MESGNGGISPMRLSTSSSAFASIVVGAHTPIGIVTLSPLRAISTLAFA